MKLIKQDKRKAEFVLKIENNDDLWELSNFIDVDDIVTGKATRKIKINEKVVKNTYTVTIKVEKVSFESEILRINGIVESEHEDIPKGSHQSIGLSIDDIFTLKKKNVLQYHYDKLEEIIKTIKSKILIAAFDKDDALFIEYNLKNFNVVFSLKAEGNKKNYFSEKETKTKKTEFFQDIADELKKLNYSNKYDVIVMASPQFWKAKVTKLLDPELKKKITEAKISNVSISAVNELVNDENISNILKDNEFLKDSKYLNKLLMEISKDGKYSYGYDDVNQYVEQGNIELLLVSTKCIRQNQKNEALFDMLKLAESTKAKVHIINSKNQAGIKLDGLGGIAAILRYKG